MERGERKATEKVETGQVCTIIPDEQQTFQSVVEFRNAEIQKWIVKPGSGTVLVEGKVKENQIKLLSKVFLILSSFCLIPPPQRIEKQNI